MITKERIDEFINRKRPSIPDFKTMSTTRVQEMIEDRTGKSLRHDFGPPRFDHQFRALGYGLWASLAMIFMGMRTGKTRVVIDWAAHLQRTGLWQGMGLVIVPVPVLVGVWEQQIKEYSNLSCACCRTAQEFEDALYLERDLTIVGLHSLMRLVGRVQPVKKRGMAEAKNKYVLDKQALDLVNQCFALSAFDETHYIANPSSLWYQIASIVMAGHAFKLGLTGTPYSREPFNVWSQVTTIDEGQTFTNNYWFFQQVFGRRNPKPFGGQYIFDKKKMTKFSTFMQRCSISYKLEEIRTVKEEKLITKLNMEDEQKKRHNTIIEKRLTEVQLRKAAGDDSKIGRTNFYNELKMMASGLVRHVLEDGRVAHIELPKHAKQEWLRWKLEDGAFIDMQVVIFFNFARTATSLKAEFKRNGIPISQLDGTTAPHKRDGEIAKFQSKQTNVFLINYKSGGAGIDCDIADWIIFYEPAASAKERMQAEKRAHGPKRGDRRLIMEDLIAAPVEAKALSYIVEGKEMLDDGVFQPRRLRESLWAR